MSWKPEYQTDNTGQWYGNALRFATEKEAMRNAACLFARWTAAREWRVVESSDPVNYSFTEDGQLVAVEQEVLV